MVQLHTFTLGNHSAFWAEQVFHLEERMSVVVGPNNCGKTAMLKALAGAPRAAHRSVLSHRDRARKFAPGARLREYKFSAGIEDFELSGDGQSLLLPVPDFEPDTIERCRQYFERLKSGETVAFTVRYEPASFILYELFEGSKFGVSCLVLSINLASGARRQMQGGALSTSFGLIAERFIEDAFMLDAERMNIGRSKFSSQSVLHADGRNLPNVLATLQGTNPKRFERYLDVFRHVLPDVRALTVVPSGDHIEIRTWAEDLSSERDDLATPLRSGGTGLAQVACILYVAMNTDVRRLILIDEPGSFLHPGAARKLVTYLRTKTPHQYVITTHSPAVMFACRSRSANMVERHGAASTNAVVRLDGGDAAGEVLRLLGARRTDLFGADEVVWVEGPTEELCLPIVLETLSQRLLGGTQFVAMSDTGALTSKHARLAVGIYERMSAMGSLAPARVAFQFDGEGWTERAREDLNRQLRGNAHFLPARMYECFLLDPDGISELLTELGEAVSVDQVLLWLGAHCSDRKYGDRGRTARHPFELDAAKVLNDMFQDLTEGRHGYDKVKYGPKLTQWVLAHRPSMLRPVASFVESILDSMGNDLRCAERGE